MWNEDGEQRRRHLRHRRPARSRRQGHILDPSGKEAGDHRQHLRHRRPLRQGCVLLRIRRTWRTRRDGDLCWDTPPRRQQGCRGLRRQSRWTRRDRGPPSARPQGQRCQERHPRPRRRHGHGARPRHGDPGRWRSRCRRAHPIRHAPRVHRHLRRAPVARRPPDRRCHRAVLRPGDDEAPQGLGLAGRGPRRVVLRRLRREPVHPQRSVRDGDSHSRPQDVPRPRRRVHRLRDTPVRQPADRCPLRESDRRRKGHAGRNEAGDPGLQGPDDDGGREASVRVQLGVPLALREVRRHQPVRPWQVGPDCRHDNAIDVGKPLGGK